MKRIALSVIAAAFALGAAAQQRDTVDVRYEIPPVRPVVPPSEQALERKLQELDSLPFAPWEPTPEEAARLDLRPVVTMSSMVVIPESRLPKKVTVLPNNVLRLAPSLTVFNGTAANWSPWPWAPWPSPGAYLDARTLSMPLPR